MFMLITKLHEKIIRKVDRKERSVRLSLPHGTGGAPRLVTQHCGLYELHGGGRDSRFGRLRLLQFLHHFFAHVVFRLLPTSSPSALSVDRRRVVCCELLIKGTSVASFTKPFIR